jgi:uncharacterized Tic20 family protein
MTSPTDPTSGSTPPEGWGPPPGWAGAPGSSADAPPAGYGTPPPGYGSPTPQGYGAPPPGWGQPGYPAPQGGPQSSEDTTWAVLGHLSYFVIPLIGPLIVFLVKKDTSPFVRQHAAEALNFHITLTIAFIVSAVLIIVLIGFVLLAVVAVAGTVLTIIAAVAGGRGQPYRYPLTLRLVS